MAMKTIKVLLDFIKLAVTAKVAFYRNVILKLTDNPAFPTPGVPYASS